MAFTPDEIRDIIAAGGYSTPAVAEYLADVLIARREKVGRYWYTKVAPLDKFSVEPSGDVSFEDLGVTSGLWESGAYHYRLIRHADGSEVESGTLTDSTSLALPQGLAGGEFYYYELRVERNGETSKPVRAYVHIGDQVRIVRVGRDA